LAKSKGNLTRTALFTQGDEGRRLHGRFVGGSKRDSRKNIIGGGGEGIPDRKPLTTKETLPNVDLKPSKGIKKKKLNRVLLSGREEKGSATL